MGEGEVTLRVNLAEFDEAVREAVEQLPEDALDRLLERLERRRRILDRQRGGH